MFFTKDQRDVQNSRYTKHNGCTSIGHNSALDSPASEEVLFLGKQLYYFDFAFHHNEDQLLKERICSFWSKFLPL